MGNFLEKTMSWSLFSAIFNHFLHKNGNLLEKKKQCHDHYFQLPRKNGYFLEKNVVVTIFLKMLFLKINFMVTIVGHFHHHISAQIPICGFFAQ
jgi:hypothetical protein